MGHGQIMDIGRGYAWSSVRVLVTSSWSSVLNMPQGGGGGGKKDGGGGGKKKKRGGGGKGGKKKKFF